MKFKINKSFNTSVDRSSRVLECAEAFGLGLEEKKFTLYDDLELEVRPGDMVYITGQSGSGKSQLLYELWKQDEIQKLNPRSIETVEMKEMPLIDQVGKSTTEAINILSAAGLNDAYLFIRKPSELSDGQRYRFRIALLMASGSSVWFADEFGAVLDRVTAKAVAINLRRQAQRAKATVVVATTHKDLKDELAPNLYIDKSYKAKVLVEYKDKED